MLQSLLESADKESRKCLKKVERLNYLIYRVKFFLYTQKYSQSKDALELFKQDLERCADSLDVKHLSTFLTAYEKLSMAVSSELEPRTPVARRRRLAIDENSVYALCE